MKIKRVVVRGLDDFYHTCRRYRGYICPDHVGTFLDKMPQRICVELSNRRFAGSKRTIVKRIFLDTLSGELKPRWTHQEVRVFNALGEDLDKIFRRGKDERVLYYKISC